MGIPNLEIFFRICAGNCSSQIEIFFRSEFELFFTNQKKKLRVMSEA
jgi:hypothetical protein